MVYMTDDGAVFETIEAAKAHEHDIEEKEKLEKQKEKEYSDDVDKVKAAYKVYYDEVMNFSKKYNEDAILKLLFDMLDE